MSEHFLISTKHSADDDQEDSASGVPLQNDTKIHPEDVVKYRLHRINEW